MILIYKNYDNLIMRNIFRQNGDKLMEKISIKTGSLNIFKPVQHNNEQKHSNPFGLSFKGNVLQADVFSSTKTKTGEEGGITSTIVEKGRAVKSAIVGGINNFNTELKNRFNNGINSIVSFGRKLGSNAKAAWRKAAETNIVFDFNGFSESFKGWANMDIVDFIKGYNANSYKVKELTKRPVGELRTMLQDELK